MDKIFRVFASHGPYSHAELDLPASDYEMLDLMDRLRLEPGQCPDAEIIKGPEYDHEYDYLEDHIQDQPDPYQLNVLAKKLSELTSARDMAAFEGLVGMEMQKGDEPIAIPKLIDFAYSTDCCHAVGDVVTDVQLGKFLVENDFVEETNDLPESALALLDYEKIGREHREREGGVYTGFGYVEQHSAMRHVSDTMDFQPQKPAYTVLLRMAARPPAGRIRPEDVIRLELPAPEAQIQEALEKLGQKDWNNVVAAIQDCSIPGMKQETYLDGEIQQVMELAQCLSELDGQSKLTKYKALLAAEDCNNLSRMISLADAVDEYILEPQISSPEDLAREELGVIVCSQDAEILLPYVDLAGYGHALLEREQAVITQYGLLDRDRSQAMDMGQSSAPEGMVMM